MAERRSGSAELATAADTIALGAELGGQLRAGDVVVLSGPLGAGKTVLAKGIAKAMDVEGAVISPTFAPTSSTVRTGSSRSVSSSQRSPFFSYL